MNKRLVVPLFAAFSFLLCGFSIPPAPAGEGDASITFTVTSAFSTDGSGDMSVEVALSQGMIIMLKSYPGFNEDTICASFMESSYDDWEGSEQKTDGAVTCIEETAFADLEAYKDLVTGDVSGGVQPQKVPRRAPVLRPEAEHGRIIGLGRNGTGVGFRYRGVLDFENARRSGGQQLR
jgi:hypothetical protein